MKASTQVWIATALLHREDPQRTEFGVEEIVKRAQAERFEGVLEKTVRQHAQQHCVAGFRSEPARLCMLTETTRGKRRLFKRGDPVHEDRVGGRITPDPSDVPDRYRPLLGWYETYSAADRNVRRSLLSQLTQYRGAGVQLAHGEHPDEQVRRLREGWDANMPMRMDARAKNY